MYRTALFIYLLLLAPLAAAQVEYELIAELDATLLKLIDSGRLPTAGSAIRIEQPDRDYHELGAVLDLSAAEVGADVLAITPGGAAERLGLRVGDRVLSLNSVALGRDLDADELRRSIDDAEGALVIEILRGSRSIELRGEADTTILPGYQLLLAANSAPASGCARLSVFDVAPRTQQIFPAVIIGIDGKAPGPGHTFRVAPGLRQITVGENIDAHRFNSLELLARGRFSAPQPGAEPSSRARVTRYKSLLIDAQPGTTYRIGARFFPDRTDAVRRNEHWEPVIWREFAQPCR
jgi:hypothetical protein